MWKKFGLLLCFAVLTNCCLAQNKERVLVGYLGVQGGEVYTYKLVFEDSLGVLKGHSYTYLFEDKEVKAMITGTIDPSNKTLSFKETSIIYNHGFESNTTICLINAVLKYKIGDDGREVYSGPITSSDMSNVFCGQGTVSFPYTEVMKQLWVKDQNTETPKPQVISKPKKTLAVVYDTSALHIPKSPNKNPVASKPEEITQGTDKMIDWYSDSLKIEVWDGGKIDGDKISVSFNGTALISNYVLAKTPKTFIIPVRETQNEITFLAKDEGNEPPMTAHVRLIDGTIIHSLLVYNKVGKAASIKIRKKSK